MRPAATRRRAAPTRSRVYRQDVRARQTQANADGILKAAVALLRRAPRPADITLEDVARDSGLTVRTILRRFGSRDRLIEAAAARLKDEFAGARVPTPPGDVHAAVSSLVAQYEDMGDFNIRVLEQEHQFPLLHRSLNEGRQFHRGWLQQVFGPALARLSPAARERRLACLYAATDVYLWKLLRRDLQMDRRQTEDVFHDLIQGVLALKTPHSKGDR